MIKITSLNLFFNYRGVKCSKNRQSIVLKLHRNYLRNVIHLLTYDLNFRGTCNANDSVRNPFNICQIIYKPAKLICTFRNSYNSKQIALYLLFFPVIYHLLSPLLERGDQIRLATRNSIFH